MATHSSVLAWIIPGAGEPGGLLSMGSHRVGHGWSDLAAAYTNTNFSLFSASLEKKNIKNYKLMKITEFIGNV